MLDRKSDQIQTIVMDVPDLISEGHLLKGIDKLERFCKVALPILFQQNETGGISAIRKRDLLAAEEKCLLSAMALNLKRMANAIFLNFNNEIHLFLAKDFSGFFFLSADPD